MSLRHEIGDCKEEMNGSLKAGAAGCQTGLFYRTDKMRGMDYCREIIMYGGAHI